MAILVSRIGWAMKITHIISGLDRGGAENVLFRLIGAQPNPSMHSVISLTDEGIFGERLRALGVEVHCLGLRRGGPTSPLVIFSLSLKLRQKRPDAVQTWMYHADLLGGIAARLAGIPVCWGIHHSNLSPEHNKRTTLLVAKACSWLSLIIPSKIISCSHRSVDVHLGLGYADKFQVIPNGLNISDYKPLTPDLRNNIRKSLNISFDCKIIGHIGRAEPLKDHSTLFATFAKIAEICPEAVLLLAGSGLHAGDEYYENILSVSPAKKFRDRIIALGQRNDIASLMAVMDVFILSSIGEAFPNVLVEAMACGTPCIATHVGDCAKIVGETGWIRPAKDVNGLAMDALSALNEPDEAKTSRRELSRRSIEERFTIEKMAESYRSVWEQQL